MTPHRFKVILNPIAGKGKGAQLAAPLQAALEGRRLAYEIVLTTAVWHGAELAREAAREGFDAVVAAGGDGTVNEVVNGLMLAAERGDRVPALGVIAVGRGNDFAYGADIPEGLEACAEVLAAGRLRAMDVGRISGGFFPEGRYFANGIGVGFDTIVGLEAAKMRHVHGFGAYVLGALKTLALFPRAPEVEVALDGGSGGHHRLASHQISIMNGKRMGGTFFMAPRARNYDGLLDLCLAERLSRRDMVALFRRYLEGSQGSHPKMRTGRAAAFSILAPQGGLVCHADGETICTDGRALEVTCLPSCLEVFHDTDLAARREAAWDSRA